MKFIQKIQQLYDEIMSSIRAYLRWLSRALILFNVAESIDSLTTSDPVTERTGNFLGPTTIDF